VPDTLYEEPVSQLLILGKVEDPRTPWRDYKALGLTPAHTPALLAMATDLELNRSVLESTEVWAPLHAWRALAQLRALEALPPLLELLDEFEGDEWLSEDLPAIAELLGPRALAALIAYLDRADNSDNRLGYLPVVEAMVRLGRKYPEARSRVIAILQRHLANYLENDDGFNGWLIDGLMTLRARQALPLMAAALVTESVDEMIVNWDHICKAFALPPTSDPADFAQQ
jgi:hypothetical protein